MNVPNLYVILGSFSVVSYNSLARSPLRISCSAVGLELDPGRTGKAPNGRPCLSINRVLVKSQRHESSAMGSRVPTRPR